MFPQFHIDRKIENADTVPRGSSEKPFSVALVVMPFASAQMPSIQIGLMTAIAKQAGFATDAFHFNLDLAAQVSPDFYERLCEHRGHMAGEWLFSKAAFQAEAPKEADNFFNAFPAEAAWAKRMGKDLEFFADLRSSVLPSFIERCLAAVDWAKYGLVGFSSTFQQNVACLALARRIKEHFPDVKIVFGGANMDSEMGPECARAFPFIDYVVSGEGDTVFPALLRALADGHSLQLPGLTARTTSNVLECGGQASPPTDLNFVPTPDYQPYFDRATELGLLPGYKSKWKLPVESSRGCWWGNKHHCTFCGLNGVAMSFRTKTPERFLDELAELSQKHKIASFFSVDNILDLKYLPTVFATIQRKKLDYRFFYEVKSNLTRAQIQILYRGGVRFIQPGIESMSSQILQLMRKGCTMLQNVRCLKWCLYYNISVGWNLLTGFPGETEEHYANQLQVLNSITHLEPPSSVNRIWLERFSPYYCNPEGFPIFEVRPRASYHYVYPSHVNLDKLAYFFDYEMVDTLPASSLQSTHSAISEWRTSWDSDRRHSLTYRRTSDTLLLDYNWGPGRKGTHFLSGALGAIYEFCVETIRTPKQVVDHLQHLPEHYDFSEADVQDAMNEFCTARLMLSEDDHYFSLALPSNPNW
jgi:ribosomal peptide maturation radical SAM protein 1